VKKRIFAFLLALALEFAAAPMRTDASGANLLDFAKPTGTIPNAESYFGAPIETGETAPEDSFSGPYAIYVPDEAEQLDAYRARMAELGYGEEKTESEETTTFAFTADDESRVILISKDGFLVICLRDDVNYDIISASGKETAAAGNGYAIVEVDGEIRTFLQNGVAQLDSASSSYIGTFYSSDDPERQALLRIQLAAGAAAGDHFSMKESSEDEYPNCRLDYSENDTGFPVYLSVIDIADLGAEGTRYDGTFSGMLNRPGNSTLTSSGLISLKSGRFRMLVDPEK